MNVEAIDLALKALQLVQLGTSIGQVVDDINQKRKAGMTAQQISDYLDAKLNADEAKVQEGIDKMPPSIG